VNALGQEESVIDVTMNIQLKRACTKQQSVVTVKRKDTGTSLFKEKETTGNQKISEHC